MGIAKTTNRNPERTLPIVTIAFAVGMLLFGLNFRETPKLLVTTWFVPALFLVG
ncbi:MAG TPA: hypothetical protein VMF66_20420 [Candidatus Acidoferrum sp.]|nr:hypothetical protein [Candidatus Acidoferrum sp.]